MNEWMLVGIVIVGTIILIGGGKWLFGSKKDTSPKQ